MGAAGWHPYGDTVVREINDPQVRFVYATVGSGTGPKTLVPARLGFRLNTMEALGEISWVLTCHPELSLLGFWCKNHPDYRTRAPFDRDRRNMARPKHIGAFRWARHVMLIRSAGLFAPHHDENSFVLREITQHAVDAMQSKRLTIEEGSIIAAALSLGFRVDRAENGWSGRIIIESTRARP